MNVNKAKNPQGESSRSVKTRKLTPNQALERNVVFHVQRYARYHKALRKEPYCVEYDGRVFSSADTRDLVKKIMREVHGVSLRNG